MTVEDRFAGRADGFDEHYTEPRGRVRLDLVLERLDHALPSPPARILDAGGGTGAFASSRFSTPYSAAASECAQR